MRDAWEWTYDPRCNKMRIDRSTTNQAPATAQTARGRGTRRLIRMQHERTPGRGRRGHRPSEICVVDGYASRITVDKRHLMIIDGAGRSRRERRYARATCALRRVVVIGHSGIVSFEALRWLTDVGAAFIQIDRDGTILATSCPTGGDARIRRGQALALFNDTGLVIARQLLTAKIAAQNRTLALVNAGASAHTEIDRALAAAEDAKTLDELLIGERDAALAYWDAWRSVEIRLA